MQKKYLRIILWIFVLFWLALIFYMSAQSGEASSQMSDRVVKWFRPWIDRFCSFDTKEEEANFYQTLSFWIRKGAHFSEYAFLAFLLFFLAKTYEVKSTSSWLTAMCFSAFYACTDEYHQSFVAGRGPQWRDVGIDSLGAVAGSLAALGLFVFWQKRKRKRKTRKETAL